MRASPYLHFLNVNFNQLLYINDKTDNPFRHEFSLLLLSHNLLAGVHCYFGLDVTVADAASLDVLYKQFSARSDEIDASLGLSPAQSGLTGPDKTSLSPFHLHFTHQIPQAMITQHNPSSIPFTSHPITPYNNPFVSSIPNPSSSVYQPFVMNQSAYPPISSSSRFNLADGGYDQSHFPRSNSQLNTPSAPPLPTVPEPDIRQPYMIMFPSVPSSSSRVPESGGTLFNTGTRTVVSVSDVAPPKSFSNLPPGREAWQPPVWQCDESTPRCTLCGENFTLIFRRHHCRACGRVVCGLCSSKSMPIPNLNYNTPVRVCDSCAKALGDMTVSSDLSQKKAAEITHSISSKVKATVSTAGAGYQALMNAVKLQTEIPESNLDYLALNCHFNKAGTSHSVFAVVISSN